MTAFFKTREEAYKKAMELHERNPKSKIVEGETIFHYAKDGEVMEKAIKTFEVSFGIYTNTKEGWEIIRCVLMYPC